MPTSACTSSGGRRRRRRVTRWSDRSAPTLTTLSRTTFSASSTRSTRSSPWSQKSSACAFIPDEAPVLREYAVPLAERALATLSKTYGFTPQRPRAHRDVPAARRLRRAERRAAGNDWCAGRLLRSRRHDGLSAAQAPRHVQLAGDAVARGGARHHAAALEPARAALADRRHFCLRRRPCAARMGPRHGDSCSRARSTRARCSSCAT